MDLRLLNCTVLADRFICRRGCPVMIALIGSLLCLSKHARMGYREQLDKSVREIKKPFNWSVDTSLSQLFHPKQIKRHSRPSQRWQLNLSRRNTTSNHSLIHVQRSSSLSFRGLSRTKWRFLFKNDCLWAKVDGAQKRMIFNFFGKLKKKASVEYNLLLRVTLLKNKRVI